AASSAARAAGPAAPGTACCPAGTPVREGFWFMSVVPSGSILHRGELQVHLVAVGVLAQGGWRQPRILDAVEVFRRDVAGDVVAVEARGLELADPRSGGSHRALHRVDALVDQGVGADRDPDLFIAAAMGDQLAAGRHVDAVDVREAD